jgi:hypothetical protein
MMIDLNRPALIAMQIPLSLLNPVETGGQMDQFTAVVLNNARYIGRDKVEGNTLYSVTYEGKQHIAESCYELILKLRQEHGDENQKMTVVDFCTEAA